MSAPEINRQIARAAVAAFGGTPSVRRYWDAPKKSSVDVMRASGDGITSYATVNLSDTPLRHDGQEFPARTELVGAMAGDTDYAAVLSTAAFCVINSGWFCAPGVVFPDVVSLHQLSTTLGHVYFTNPTLWDDRLPTLELADRVVAWLLVLPISDSEYEYIEAHGPDAFEELLESSGADIFDINRPPVA